MKYYWRFHSTYTLLSMLTKDFLKGCLIFVRLGFELMVGQAFVTLNLDRLYGLSGLEYVTSKVVKQIWIVSFILELIGLELIGKGFT